MRKNSELLFSLLLLPVDFAAILFGFVSAYALRVKIDPRPVAHPLGFVFFLKIFLLIIPVWILIFSISGLYSLSSLRGRWQEIGKIFVGVSSGVMFMIVVDFASRQPIFPSKAVPIYAYGLCFAAVTVARLLVRGVQRSLFSRGVGIYNVVLVGSGPIAQQISYDLSHSASSGYRVIGALDTAKGAQARMKPIRVDSTFKNLLNRHKGVGIDEIIQADSSLEPDEVYSLVEYATNHHITYRFVPNLFGIFASHSEIGTLAGTPMVAIKRTPLEGWGRIVKRAFDMAGALVGLIVLSPLLAVIAIIIKATDPGPVFYRHKRLSRTGKPIYLLKFRTMKAAFCTGEGFTGKTDAEIFAELGRPELAEEFKKEQKLSDDPRVSSVGKWLRKTSLDELPQLWNILKGNLSTVGPRPIVTDELEKYGSGRSALLALKPGLTGLWQISGRSDLGYDERVKLDLFYVENWSLWLDIKIVFKTILTVIFGKGAY